jgi:hypothetical protein
MAHANSTSGVAGKKARVTATHDASVKNLTDSPQMFSYFYTLCAEGRDCVKQGSKVTLQPHAEWHASYTSEMIVTYKNRGVYTTTASTQVTALNINKIYTTSGYLTVI